MLHFGIRVVIPVGFVGVGFLSFYCVCFVVSLVWCWYLLVRLMVLSLCGHSNGT